MGTAAARLGKAADGELLAFQALHLEPIEAAARAVRGVAAFGDDALQVQVASLVDDLFPCAFQIIAI